MSGRRLPPLIEEQPAVEGGGGTGRENKPSLRARAHHFFSTPQGMAVAGLVVLIGLGFGVLRLWGEVGGGGDWPRVRVMDVHTGDLRWARVRPGGAFPYENPSTGERTMYPVEYCFENECGPAGGTPVILNAYLDGGPTECPRCGAAVTSHNSRPPEFAGVRPDDW